MSTGEHPASPPSTTHKGASARGKNQILEVDADIDPVVIRRLCERLQRVVERAGDGPVMCDVNVLRIVDVRVADALARLQLTARRLGSSICLLHARSELVELLEFTGLLDVLPTRDLEEDGLI